MSRFTRAELETVLGRAAAARFLDEEAAAAPVQYLGRHERFGKSETLTSRNDRALRNRLHSIALDSAFVARVVATAPPGAAVLANLRNGAWYVEGGTSCCRFKSVDGHLRGWTFNLTRANLACLRLGLERGSLVVVDATRKGKAFPDALTRTLPLWVALVNRAAGCTHESLVSIQLPPWLQPSFRQADHFSEEQLRAWASQLRALEPDARVWSEVRRRPFRVVRWVGNDRQAWRSSHEDAIDARVAEDDDDTRAVATRILCVSASASNDLPNDVHRELHSWSYVPGAGDDEEEWRPHEGFTSDFWHRHKSELLACADNDELEDLVASLLARPGGGAPGPTGFVRVGPEARLWLTWPGCPGAPISASEEEEEKASPTPRRVLDFTDVRAEDKAWTVKHPETWGAALRTRAAGGAKEAAGRLEIRANDPSTALAVALCVLLVRGENREGAVEPARDAKQRGAQVLASLLVEAERQGCRGAQVPRRLVKDVAAAASRPSSVP